MFNGIAKVVPSVTIVDLKATKLLKGTSQRIAKKSWSSFIKP